MFINTEKSPLAKKIPNKKQLNSPAVTGLVNEQPLLCAEHQSGIPSTAAASRPGLCFSKPTCSGGRAVHTQQSLALPPSRNPV